MSLDVTVQVEPHVQVVSEQLVRNGQKLLYTEAPDPMSSDINARWDNRKQGPSPRLAFRASRLLASQAASRIPSATQAGRQINLAAAQVLAALRGVFLLNPVPHLMRQYVPSRDVLLRRDADNLSAAIADLVGSPASRHHIRQAMATLNEQDVVDVTTSKSELGDVMLTLVERSAVGEFPVPARLMSDGSLRFLAILAAVMQAPTIDAAPDPLASEDAAGQTTVVIEELENGLHASQASTLVRLIREQVLSRRVRALATAHSPAVLDALTGDEHSNVVICQRGADGRSTLTRLVDLPNYWRISALGGLGRAAERDRLRTEHEQEDEIMSASRSGFQRASVDIWTLEAVLGSYA